MSIKIKNTFINELGNEITIHVQQKHINGFNGIHIELIGPSSTMESHITSMEAYVLAEFIKIINEIDKENKNV